LEDIVEIIHCKVEDLGDRGAAAAAAAGGETKKKDAGGKSKSSLQPHSFDVILSEWMGYALTFECMLETVLKARDMWLKPGGLVLPNVAEIYVQGMGDLADWKKAVSLSFVVVSTFSSSSSDSKKKKPLAHNFFFFITGWILGRCLRI
jgi:hypothetical protein